MYQSSDLSRCTCCSRRLSGHSSKAISTDIGGAKAQTGVREGAPDLFMCPFPHTSLSFRSTKNINRYCITIYIAPCVRLNTAFETTCARSELNNRYGTTHTVHKILEECTLFFKNSWSWIHSLPMCGRVQCICLEQHSWFLQRVRHIAGNILQTHKFDAKHHSNA